MSLLDPLILFLSVFFGIIVAVNILYIYLRSSGILHILKQIILNIYEDYNLKTYEKLTEYPENQIEKQGKQEK